MLFLRNNNQGKMITKKESTCINLFEQWKLTDEDEFTLMIIIARDTDGKEKAILFMMKGKRDGVVCQELQD